MRWFCVCIVLLALAIGVWLQLASPAESCHGDSITELKQLFPRCALLYTFLLLTAVRKKSTQLILLAGFALWYALSMSFHGICGHESYAAVILMLALLVLLPLGIGYAYARKEADFVLLILYFLALIPAIIYLA